MNSGARSYSSCFSFVGTNLSFAKALTENRIIMIITQRDHYTHTIHIVYKRTEQARTEQAGETRLHPAGCNLLTYNKLPSYRTSSWMKISSSKLTVEHTAHQSHLNCSKTKTSDRRSTDADSRPITSALKCHLFLPLIYRFQGDHSVWGFLSTRGGGPY